MEGVLFAEGQHILSSWSAFFVSFVNDDVCGVVGDGGQGNEL
jgi:hypothetical protein